jgi:glycosyltransferase involved in cell wall biosynthesis
MTPAIQPGRASIVIAAYNSAATIDATLESCLAQTYADCEVVVVDDGSRDDTVARVRAFGDRVRLVVQPNGGLPNARNVGVRAASGEFIAWMDADDLCHPDRVRLGVAVLRAHPDVELVCSDFSAFTDPERDFEASHLAAYYRSVRREGGVAGLYDEMRPASGEIEAPLYLGQAYERLLKGNFAHPPTVMVRRSVFDRVGYFDEALRYNSDYDQILRIARAGRFAFLDKALLRYRRSDAQMSHGSAGGRIPLETLQILDKVRRDDPETARRNASVLRARTAQALVEAAEMVVYSGRWDAFKFLLRSLPYGPDPRSCLRTTVKLLVPRGFIQAAKRGMARFVPGAPPHR